VVIGDGLPARSAEAFLTVLAEDARFRDLPVGLYGLVPPSDKLANVARCRDPQRLIERLAPLVRMHAFEGALKRLVKSIDSKGMHDAATGLLNAEAFGRELSRAIDDAGERGVGLSLARFSFDDFVALRVSLDAARLMGRLIRNIDFGCRQDDGSVLIALIDADLRSAHVAARRLGSVLRHTMLRPNDKEPRLIPTVTLATLKPKDTLLSLMARVAPRQVAAE
jgi:PleD family two-component response regulator